MAVEVLPIFFMHLKDCEVSDAGYFSLAMVAAPVASRFHRNRINYNTGEKGLCRVATGAEVKDYRFNKI